MWFFYSSPISKGERSTPCRLSIIDLFIRRLDEYICIYICPNAYTDFSHAQPAHYLGTLSEFQIRKKTHTHEGIQARYRTDISIRGLFWRYYTKLVPKSYIQWRAEIAAIDPKDALAEKTVRDIYCGKLTRTCIFAEYILNVRPEQCRSHGFSEELTRELWKRNSRLLIQKCNDVP